MDTYRNIWCINLSGVECSKTKVIWFKVYTKKCCYPVSQLKLKLTPTKTICVFFGWNIVSWWVPLLVKKWSYKPTTGDRAHRVGMFQGLNPDVGDWIFHTSPEWNPDGSSIRSTDLGRVSVQRADLYGEPAGTTSRRVRRGSFGGFLLLVPGSKGWGFKKSQILEIHQSPGCKMTILLFVDTKLEVFFGCEQKKAGFQAPQDVKWHD